ncbi:hypothetical protein LINGRAHAP2_LOCUS17910 [Linum grandiflorum]
MLGGNSANHLLPVYMDDNRIPYQNNASNQLQLFGNLPAGCNVDAVNYFGIEHVSPMVQTNKRSREAEDFSRQQKLQISLNYNICQDEVDRVLNPNVVSTGLRLSYDDEERNSSLTSASGSMTTKPSMILSLGDNIRTELDRQKEEFDQYIKIQVLFFRIMLNNVAFAVYMKAWFGSWFRTTETIFNWECQSTKI